MGRWKELKGNQYGHLYVLEDFHGKGNLHYCKCICDCENHTIKNVRACHLLSGAIDNCGCVTRERLKKSSTHHGMKFTRFYMTWQTFRRRCQANNTRKNHYITINDEVKTLTQWIEFYDIAPSTVKNYIRKGYSDIDAINMARKVRRS